MTQAELPLQAPAIAAEIGAALRDQGVSQIVRRYGGTTEEGLELLRRLLVHFDEITADELRLAAEADGFIVPNPNFWGALMLGAARRGLIVKTDRVRPSARIEARAHCNPVWRRGPKA